MKAYVMHKLQLLRYDYGGKLRIESDDEFALLKI